MLSNDAIRLNQAFVKKASDDINNLSDQTTLMVRTRIRELSVFRKVLPPQYVTRPQLQVDLNTDTLYDVVWLEPSSTAVITTFAGNSPAMQITGSKVPVWLFNVQTPEFQKREEEIMTYPFPIYKIIEDNSIKDMEEKEDFNFMTLCLTAVAGTSKALTYTPPFTKMALAALVAVLDLSMYSGDVANIVMHKYTFDQFLLGSLSSAEAGYSIVSEVFVNGYKAQTIFGHNFFVTKKSNIVPPGVVLAFASPQWLGKWDLFGDAKFWMFNEKGLLRWNIRETLGMVIANINNVAIAMTQTSISLTSTGLTSSVLGLPPYSENPIITSTYGLTIS